MNIDLSVDLKEEKKKYVKLLKENKKTNLLDDNLRKLYKSKIKKLQKEIDYTKLILHN